MLFIENQCKQLLIKRIIVNLISQAQQQPFINQPYCNIRIIYIMLNNISRYCVCELFSWIHEMNDMF